MADGRFAPSPSGPLHLGNLRTALLAWLYARQAGSRFLVRVEDLDPVSSRPEHVAGHLADLAALGLAWDGPVVVQSERRALHDAALRRLVDAGTTYPCYCSRREVREAAVAAHGDEGAATYPGTCRDLGPAARARREAEGRRPALRLRAEGVRVAVHDRFAGRVERDVDDVVLRRADGVPAYNLAVVVDDVEQGVEEVVRGVDLLDVTPTQAHLADLLGLPRPAWTHVALVVGPDGARLAKRHGAVSLAELGARGVAPGRVRAWMGAGLGLCEPDEPVAVELLLERFDPSVAPPTWTFDPSRADPGR
ncbi:MAG: tRNA glutamyl-Q(34) synthetase GluQRS [Acidimicrobiia bacterium]